ncbi:transcriptional regulator, ArsR family protein [Verrucomicrobiia bacterium DG1235]|nr:transcriptional regulator, ArsR family protein [Verrucomicrobiae bacterium DG1235]
MKSTRTQVPTHDVFKALGHPARITIVQALASEERCVCELVEKVGLGWSTVSRHLSVLREAGIVADDKRGLQVYYRLTLPCVSRFIACLESPADFPQLFTGCCS